MAATALLFNIKDENRVKEISRTLLPLRIRTKVINKDDYLKPIGYLAGMKNIESTEKIYQGYELEDEMLLMSGFTNSQVSQLLAAFRKKRIEKIDHKAILTPSNKLWNALELFQELKKEHDYMTSNATGKSEH